MSRAALADVGQMNFRVEKRPENRGAAPLLHLQCHIQARVQVSSSIKSHPPLEFSIMRIERLCAVRIDCIHGRFSWYIVSACVINRWSRVCYVILSVGGGQCSVVRSIVVTHAENIVTWQVVLHLIDRG